MGQSRISLAQDHVEKGRVIVARQRALIERLRVNRHDTRDAEELLARFEATLRIFTDDLDRLEQAAPGGA